MPPRRPGWNERRRHGRSAALEHDVRVDSPPCRCDVIGTLPDGRHRTCDATAPLWVGALRLLRHVRQARSGSSAKAGFSASKTRSSLQKARCSAKRRSPRQSRPLALWPLRNIWNMARESPKSLVGHSDGQQRSGRSGTGRQRCVGKAEPPVEWTRGLPSPGRRDAAGRLVAVGPACLITPPPRTGSEPHQAT